MRQVNIGCAQYRLQHFENYDVVDRVPEIVLSEKFGGKDFRLIKHWSEVDYNADLIYAGHFLEHLPKSEVVPFLTKVATDLVHGQFWLAVPIIDNHAQLDWEQLQMLVSIPQNPGDMEAGHRTVWRRLDVIQLLQKFFGNVEQQPYCEFATSPSDTTNQVFVRCRKESR